MKNLWIYLKEYRKESVLAPLFKLLEACMDLLVPLVVAAIINDGIGGSDEGLIVRYFLLLIALAVLGMGFSFTSQWMSAKASVGFSTKLRQALFDHIQTLSYKELDTLGADTIITRLTSDINQIQNGLNLALRLLLRSPFIVFGAMIMAFTIDTRCALIFAGAIIVLSLVVFGIMLRSIPLFSRVQEALDRLLGHTRENLTGVRVIRAFCKEEQEVEDFDEQNARLTKMNERVGRLSALMNPGTYLIINLATIFLIRQGALQVHLGDLQQGDVVALYNYMAQIVVELVKLASLIITINKSLACGRRVSAMMDVQPSMTYPEETPEGSDIVIKSAMTCPQAAPEPSETSPTAAPAADGSPAVQFRDVSFAYDASGDEVLTGIDFAAGRGQTIGIIGGTGSGKSTLVQLISRFYDVTSGQVLVDGADVREYPEGMLTQKIGVVPQKAVLFEGSIRDNLRWGNEEATDEMLWDALKTAQADEIVLGKDGQLDARIEQGGRNLSGGQKQRLTIARALVKHPEILILDDSASALDYATDLSLRRALAALPDDPTVFIVSQRTSSVRQADQILVLDDGCLVGAGRHDDLLQNCDVYREIYASQFPDSASAIADSSESPTSAQTDFADDGAKGTPAASADDNRSEVRV